MGRATFAAAFAASVVVLSGGAAQAGVVEMNAALDAMGHYNLIVKGDLTSSTEVEGRTFVGGSVLGNASNYNIDNLPGTGLTVVGNVEGGKKNVSGDIAIGGNVTSGVEFQQGGAQVLSYGGTLSNTNVNAPDTAVQVAGLGADLAAQRDAMFGGLTELSTYLASLDATDTVQFVDNNAIFDATSGGDVAVFNIQDFTAFQNKSVQFIFPASYDLVVINVLSTSSLATAGGMNFNGPSGLGTKVIWNFAGLSGGDTLAFNNSWYGSVLAPGAIVSNNTLIEGTLVAGAFNQGGEVHTPGFGGYRITQAIPEPATWAMMILGFGAAGTMLRLRRRLAFA
ncbi:MAG: collagen-binding domain-containing protein [Pseudomonadota bacterium]